MEKRTESKEPVFTESDQRFIDWTCLKTGSKTCVQSTVDHVHLCSSAASEGQQRFIQIFHSNRLSETEIWCLMFVTQLLEPGRAGVCTLDYMYFLLLILWITCFQEGDKHCESSTVWRAALKWCYTSEVLILYFSSLFYTLILKQIL